MTSQNNAKLSLVRILKNWAQNPTQEIVQENT